MVSGGPRCRTGAATRGWLTGTGGGHVMFKLLFSVVPFLNHLWLYFKCSVDIKNKKQLLSFKTGLLRRGEVRMEPQRTGGHAQ